MSCFPFCPCRVPKKWSSVVNLFFQSMRKWENIARGYEDNLIISCSKTRMHINGLIKFADRLFFSASLKNRRSGSLISQRCSILALERSQSHFAWLPASPFSMRWGHIKAIFFAASSKNWSKRKVKKCVVISSAHAKRVSSNDDMHSRRLKAASSYHSERISFASPFAEPVPSCRLIHSTTWAYGFLKSLPVLSIMMSPYFLFLFTSLRFDPTRNILFVSYLQWSFRLQMTGRHQNPCPR